MCGPHFGSMKITEDVRKFAAQQKISEEDALKVGLQEKAQEFVEKGAEIYERYCLRRKHRPKLLIVTCTKSLVQVPR